MPDNVGVLPDMLRIYEQVAEREQTATAPSAPKGFMSYLKAPPSAAVPPAPVPVSAFDEMRKFASAAGAAEVAPIGPEEFGLPPRHLWKDLGEIGSGESFGREGWQQGVVERTPFTGSAVSASRLFSVHQAARTLKDVADGGYNIGKLWRRYKAHPTLERDPIVQDTAAALKVAMPFYYEAEMARERGVSVPAKVLGVLADLVPFAIEFAVTGGLAAPARAGVKKAVGEVAEKVVGRAVGRAIGGLAGAATSAAVRTAASPGMVLESLVRRRLPTGFHITDKGDLEITEPTEGAAMAVAKAFGDVFVEQFTEEAGATLAKGVAGIGKFALSPFARIPGATETANKLRGAIQNAWVSMVPGRTGRQFAKRAFSRAAFDGILEEMGEERLGEVMRSVLNIQSVEKDDPRSMLQRYRDAMPSGEQLLVEALAFSVPGAARAGLGLAMDARRTKAQSTDPNFIAARAAFVAAHSNSPAEQRMGQKVVDQIVAGEPLERSLRDKVLDISDGVRDQLDKELRDRPPPPAAVEEGPAPVIIPAEQQQAAIVPAETIPLGVERLPVLNPALERMSEDDFTRRRWDAEKKVSDLETEYDGNLSLERDASFRARLARAQDEVSALEHEAYRRKVVTWTGQDIAEELRQLDPGSSADKLKVAILVRAAQASGEVGAVRSALEAEGRRSPDQAESVQWLLEKMGRLASEQQAATSQPVAAEEVQGRAEELSVPPTEQVSEPAPAAANITIEMPREEGPAPTAGEVEVRYDKMGGKDFEASVRVSEAAGAEHPDVVGISIQDAPNGRYVVRAEGVEGEADLHGLIASQLSEMTDAERIQTLKALESESALGVNGVREIIKAFYVAAPRLAARSRLAATWGVNPTLPSSGAPAWVGGLHPEQAAGLVQPLYDKYKKVLPGGVLRKLLGDWVSWKQLGKGGASPEVLMDWVRRRKPSPIKAAYIGAVSSQMTAKELKGYIDALKGKLDGPTADVLAKAYRSALGARTTSEVNRVLEAVSLAVENHNRAVAVAALRVAIKDIKDRGLLPEYQKKLDALLADVTTKKPTQASFDWALGVLGAAEKAEQERQKGEEKQLDDPLYSDVKAARKVIEDWQKRPIGELSSKEIKDITAAIGVLANMDRLKRELLGAQKGRAFEAVLDSALADVERRYGKRFAEKYGQQNARAIMSKVYDLLVAEQASHQTIAYIIFGKDSAAYDVLVRQLRKADNRTASVWMKAIDQFKSALAANDLTLRDVEKWSDAVGQRGKAATLDLKMDSGLTARLTVGEAMELFLHSRDKSTLEQLRTSKGFVIGQSKLEHETTGADLDRLGRQLEAEYPEAHRLALAMSDILNGELWFEMRKAWREHHFYELPNEVDYYPRRRVHNEQEAEEASDFMAHWHRQVLDDMGIFQEREGSKEAVIVRDVFSTFYRHVNKVATYIGKAAPSTNAIRLLNNREFQTGIDAALKYGPEWRKKMKKAIVMWTGAEVQDREVVESIVRKFIRGAHVGVLGLKPKIVLYQGVSFINCLNEMGAKFLFAEVGTDSTAKIRDEMHQYAPVLDMRIKGSGHNIISPGSGDAGIHEMFGGKERLMTRIGLDPIHWGDNQVMYRIWQAAKAEGTEKGLVGDELMRYVGERAQDVVDLTQPTYDALTVSGLQNQARKNPLLALALLYRSQSNKNVNMAARAYADWVRGDDKRLGVMLGKVFLPIVGNSLGVAVIAALYKLLKGEMLTQVFGAPDDEERAAKAVKEMAWGTAERTLTQWMLGGDFASLALTASRHAWEHKPFSTLPERNNVMVSAGIDALATIFYINQALADMDEQYKSGPRKYDSKSPSSWINAGERLGRTLSVAAGIPIQELTDIGARVLKAMEEQP